MQPDWEVGQLCILSPSGRSDLLKKDSTRFFFFLFIVVVVVVIVEVRRAESSFWGYHCQCGECSLVVV